jgi:hypothetical protein
MMPTRRGSGRRVRAVGAFVPDAVAREVVEAARLGRATFTGAAFAFTGVVFTADA